MKDQWQVTGTTCRPSKIRAPVTSDVCWLPVMQ